MRSRYSLYHCHHNCCPKLSIVGNSIASNDATLYELSSLVKSLRLISPLNLLKGLASLCSPFGFMLIRIRMH